MKQIIVRKDGKPWEYEFSDEIGVRDIKMIQRTLLRQYNLKKRGQRINRAKNARRLQPTQPQVKADGDKKAEAEAIVARAREAVAPKGADE